MARLIGEYVNPFIQLLERPVETLTFTGYAIIMLGIAVLGSSYIIRVGSRVAAATERPYRQGRGPYGEWWGEFGDGWLPPEDWVRDAATVAAVAVVMVWALATVVHMVG